jgi:hypothetical protein
MREKGTECGRENGQSLKEGERTHRLNAVTMVHVPIKDENAFFGVLLLGHFGRKRDAVENAKA